MEDKTLEVTQSNETQSVVNYKTFSIVDTNSLLDPDLGGYSSNKMINYARNYARFFFLP